MILMHAWKPGIKVGPQNYQENLGRSHAKYCEVWYRVDREGEYTDMFSYLQEHGIHAGLHFWAMLQDKIAPNLAYPDEKIWKPSLELMQKNLEIAAKHHHAYVNIHVGNAALEKMDLDRHKSMPIEHTVVDYHLAERTAEKNILTLQTYAKKLGVLLIIETVPPYDPEGWDSDQNPNARLHAHATHALSNVFVEHLGKDLGIAINNDISHTAAELITNDREQLWQYLYARTVALAPYTKLIHANTMAEPFNGTDSHDGILDSDFAHNVFPSKLQFEKLLSVFQSRDDVWIVNEPQRDHVQNYNALVAFHQS